MNEITNNNQLSFYLCNDYKNQKLLFQKYKEWRDFHTRFNVINNNNINCQSREYIDKVKEYKNKINFIFDDYQYFGIINDNIVCFIRYEFFNKKCEITSCNEYIDEIIINPYSDWFEFFNIFFQKFQYTQTTLLKNNEFIILNIDKYLNHQILIDYFYKIGCIYLVKNASENIITSGIPLYSLMSNECYLCCIPLHVYVENLTYNLSFSFSIIENDNEKIIDKKINGKIVNTKIKTFFKNNNNNLLSKFINVKCLLFEKPIIYKSSHDDVYIEINIDGNKISSRYNKLFIRSILESTSSCLNLKLIYGIIVPINLSFINKNSKFTSLYTILTCKDSKFTQNIRSENLDILNYLNQFSSCNIKYFNITNIKYPKYPRLNLLIKKKYEFPDEIFDIIKSFIFPFPKYRTTNHEKIIRPFINYINENWYNENTEDVEEEDTEEEDDEDAEEEDDEDTEEEEYFSKYTNCFISKIIFFNDSYIYDSAVTIRRTSNYIILKEYSLYYRLWDHDAYQDTINMTIEEIKLYNENYEDF